MLDGQCGVLVGYSGGADSSALLYLLKEQCDKLGLYLHALHVHHGIRGAEADRDAEFCRLTCERLGVEFTLECADIPRLARESGRGVEETARAFRYDAFVKKVRSDARLSCIATAHNADDNAETVIFNLTRGGGISGMCGIPPKRDVAGIPVIRPLLYAAKRDIVGYCEQNGIQYILDSTNADTAYTRNYIRHEIIPRLENINPSLLTAVRRMTQNLMADSGYLDRTARNFAAENAPDGSVDVSALSSVDRAISSRVVCALFARVSEKTLERVHIDAVLRLAREYREGASVSLAGGIRAVCEGGKLYFTAEPCAQTCEFEYLLHEGINRFDTPNFAVLVAKSGISREDLQKDNETLQNIYKLSIHTQIRFDTINHALFVRSRRDGDAYVYGGMTRKLKKLYNDRGFGAKKRRETPIFCDGDGIVWVPGFSVADRAKPSGDVVDIIYYYNGEEK